MQYPPPTSTTELIERALFFEEWTLAELANHLNAPLPQSLRYAKGWFGQCMEHILGATSGNLPRPDFQDLGVELKTIPIQPNGVPLESTYVCTAPIPFQERRWQDSRVYHKLHQVLWLPLVGERHAPMPNKKIGRAILWSPTPEVEKILEKDWYELTEYLTLGHFDSFSAKQGTYLHLRPKAANTQNLLSMQDAQGRMVGVVPQGFYLRTALTRDIVSLETAHESSPD